MLGVEGIGADRAQNFLPSGGGETYQSREVGDVDSINPPLAPPRQPRKDKATSPSKEGSSVFKNRENPDRALGMHGGCYTAWLFHSWRQMQSLAAAVFSRDFSETDLDMLARLLN